MEIRYAANGMPMAPKPKKVEQKPAPQPVVQQPVLQPAPQPVVQQPVPQPVNVVNNDVEQGNVSENNQ